MEQIKSTKFQKLAERGMKNILGGATSGATFAMTTTVSPLSIDDDLLYGKVVACDEKRRELLNSHSFTRPDGVTVSVQVYGPTTAERLKGFKKTDGCLQCED